MCKPRGISGNGTHMFPIGFQRRCQPASQLAGGPAAATLAPPQPRGGGQQGLEAGRSRGNDVGPSPRALLSSILITHCGCLYPFSRVGKPGRVWVPLCPLPAPPPGSLISPGDSWSKCACISPPPRPVVWEESPSSLAPGMGSAIGSGSGCDPVPLENFRRTNEKEALLGLPGIRTPPGAAKASCGQGGGPAGAQRPPRGGGGTLALVTLAGPPDPAEPEGEAAPQTLHSQR